MLPTGKRGRRPSVFCFLCDKVIDTHDESAQIAIDWVRFSKEAPKITLKENIPIHRACKETTPQDTLQEALKKHIKTTFFD